MSKKNNTSSSLPMILFIVFLILKLTDSVDWSWWWVTSPLWIPVVILLCIGVISFLIVMFALVFGFSFTEIIDAAEAYKRKIQNNRKNKTEK